MTTPTRHATGGNDRVEGAFVVRFDRNERVLHWVSAVAVLAAVATGAILYVEPLSVAVGRRVLVKDLHVVAGFAAVVPFLVAMAGPWRRGLQRDVDRFANWHEDDVAWLRRRTRAGSETGKFNGGQKLNAVLLSGALVVMAMTGSIMKWFGPFPLSWRSGATFVHDWASFGLWFLIPAHIIKALTTPGAVRGMWTGWIGRAEAESRTRWWASIEGDRSPPAAESVGNQTGR
ncbi:MAG: cytochrome b/b6 domain-containing protein [Acidimicrobiales bacterium]|nr:cytochrome b/b6 domain-containing protein [Acidimicrobiales bacterium]